jgi:hypothetical protein
MPTFPVQIINNTTPALSVEVADSGVPPVTYQQVKQSLGSQVYKINELYLYSENINQLLGIIQYQRFDADGNQTYSSIATTIDPYEGNSVAIVVDLKKYKEDFILNGNSSFSGTILPNTYLQLKFWANRITNEFGRNFNNFQQIEIDANKPFFFNNYGSLIPEIRETNLEIEKTATLDGVTELPPHEKLLESTSPQQMPEIEDYRHLLFLGIAAIAAGTYILKNKQN